VCGRGIEKEILKCLKRKVIEEENLKYIFTSFFSSHTEMSEGNYYKERSINVFKNIDSRNLVDITPFIRCGICFSVDALTNPLETMHR